MWRTFAGSHSTTEAHEKVSIRCTGMAPPEVTIRMQGSTDDTTLPTFTCEPPATAPKPPGARKKGLTTGTPLIRKERGVRRPYRALDESKLHERTATMQKRSDALSAKLQRASQALQRLKQEAQHRGAERPSEPASAAEARVA